MKFHKILLIRYRVIAFSNLRERYNEALLKKTELTMKDSEDVMKKLNIN